MLRVTLAGAVIGIILTHIPPSVILETISATAPPALGVLILGSLAGILVQWRKWFLLLKQARPSTTPGEGLSSLFAGFGFGLITPGRLGELGRGSLLGGRRSASAGAAVADRLCSFSATGFAGFVGLAYLNPPAGLTLLPIAFIVWIILFRGLRQVRIDPATAPLSWLGETAGRIILDVADTVQAVPPSLWVRTMAWSLLFNIVFFAQFIVVASGLIAFTGKLVAVTPIIFTLKAIVPIGFLDLGAREGAAVLTFSWQELDPAVGLSCAFLVYMTNVLIPGVIGWVIILRNITAPRYDNSKSDPTTEARLS